MRWLGLVLGLICGSVAAAPATGFGATALQVEVIDSGRYRILQREPRQTGGASSAGYSSVVATEWLSESIRVPLQLGEAFGFRYRLQVPEASAEWLPLQIVVQHPPLTDVRGQRSRGFVIDSAARRDSDGSYRNGAFYLLSEPRELVAGRWRIALFHGGRRLIEREFVLGDEVAGTQLAKPEAWPQ
jgi:hypothetical protein